MHAWYPPFIRAGSLLVLAAAGVDAHAQPPQRVVIVPKVLANGQPRDAGPLAAWAHQALHEAGHRSIDLDASLQGQAFALSDAVAAGRIPDALTVLNADAAWSVQLSCDRDEAGHRAALGLTYFCTLQRSIVRVGQGDRVVSESVAWNDVFGANIAQALFAGNVAKRAPALLAADLDTWAEASSGATGWDVDLRVTGVPSRSQAQALVARLERVPGVGGVRLVAFSSAVTQIALSGQGQQALDALPDELDTQASLGLVLTHATDRALHARLDAGRIHRRRAQVFVETPARASAKSTAALVRTAGDPAVGAAVTNLSWLEPAGREEGPADARKLAEASAADVPWALAVRFVQGDGLAWGVTARLLATDGGRELLTAAATAEDPLRALDEVIRALDERFVTAASDRSARVALGLPADAAAPTRGVAFGALDLAPLFPSRAASYATEGLGVASLVHRGERAATEVRLQVRAGDAVIFDAAVEDLAPGARVHVPITLAALPPLDPTQTRTLPVQATVTYRDGESFGRARAYGALLAHRSSAVDWSEPASVAAFVDPNDPGVRALATQALARELPGRAPRTLERAAAVYSAAWGPPLGYVPDPVSTAFDGSIDDVQHPSVTLARLAGDCDDLTVLLASLFESVGISTAILTTPGHVLLGVDSGLLAGGGVLLDLPPERFVQVDGALFVPIEATALAEDFMAAWRHGAELVQAAGDDVEAFRTRDAWRRYPTVAPQRREPPALSARRDARLPDLPALMLPPRPPEGAHPLALPVFRWLSGEREGVTDGFVDACDEGHAESCYNLAVTLAASTPAAPGQVFPDPVLDALCLMPPPVVTMLLDHGGLGRGDDRSEASSHAEARRRLEDALARATERRGEEGAVGAAALRAVAAPGRRGSAVADPPNLAPLFFFEPVSR